MKISERISLRARATRLNAMTASQREVQQTRRIRPYQTARIDAQESFGCLASCLYAALRSKARPCKLFQGVLKLRSSGFPQTSEKSPLTSSKSAPRKILAALITSSIPKSCKRSVEVTEAFMRNSLKSSTARTFWDPKPLATPVFSVQVLLGKRPSDPAICQLLHCLIIYCLCHL